MAPNVSVNPAELTLCAIYERVINQGERIGSRITDRYMNELIIICVY